MSQLTVATPLFLAFYSANWAVKPTSTTPRLKINPYGFLRLKSTKTRMSAGVAVCLVVAGIQTCLLVEILLCTDLTVTAVNITPAVFVCVLAPLDKVEIVLRGLVSKACGTDFRTLD